MDLVSIALLERTRKEKATRSTIGAVQVINVWNFHHLVVKEWISLIFYSYDLIGHRKGNVVIENLKQQW